MADAGVIIGYRELVKCSGVDSRSTGLWANTHHTMKGRPIWADKGIVYELYKWEEGADWTPEGLLGQLGNFAYDEDGEYESGGWLDRDWANDQNGIGGPCQRLESVTPISETYQWSAEMKNGENLDSEPLYGIWAAQAQMQHERQNALDKTKDDSPLSFKWMSNLGIGSLIPDTIEAETIYSAGSMWKWTENCDACMAFLASFHEEDGIWNDETASGECCPKALDVWQNYSEPEDGTVFEVDSWAAARSGVMVVTNELVAQDTAEIPNPIFESQVQYYGYSAKPENVPEYWPTDADENFLKFTETEKLEIEPWTELFQNGVAGDTPTFGNGIGTWGGGTPGAPTRIVREAQLRDIKSVDKNYHFSLPGHAGAVEDEIHESRYRITHYVHFYGIEALVAEEESKRWKASLSSEEIEDYTVDLDWIGGENFFSPKYYQDQLKHVGLHIANIKDKGSFYLNHKYGNETCDSSRADMTCDCSSEDPTDNNSYYIGINALEATCPCTSGYCYPTGTTSDFFSNRIPNIADKETCLSGGNKWASASPFSYKSKQHELFYKIDGSSGDDMSWISDMIEGTQNTTIKKWFTGICESGCDDSLHVIDGPLADKCAWIQRAWYETGFSPHDVSSSWGFPPRELKTTTALAPGATEISVETDNPWMTADRIETLYPLGCKITIGQDENSEVIRLIGYDGDDNMVFRPLIGLKKSHPKGTKLTIKKPTVHDEASLVALSPADRTERPELTSALSTCCDGGTAQTTVYDYKVIVSDIKQCFQSENYDGEDMGRAFSYEGRYVFNLSSPRADLAETVWYSRLTCNRIEFSPKGVFTGPPKNMDGPISLDGERIWENQDWKRYDGGRVACYRAGVAGEEGHRELIDKSSSRTLQTLIDWLADQTDKETAMEYAQLEREVQEDWDFVKLNSFNNNPAPRIEDNEDAYEFISGRPQDGYAVPARPGFWQLDEPRLGRFLDMYDGDINTDERFGNMVADYPGKYDWGRCCKPHKTCIPGDSWLNDGTCLYVKVIRQHLEPCENEGASCSPAEAPEASGLQALDQESYDALPDHLKGPLTCYDSPGNTCYSEFIEGSCMDGTEPMCPDSYADASGCYEQTSECQEIPLTEEPRLVDDPHVRTFFGEKYDM
tara:strand:- start:8540 stop:11932 length:3393 start_codon:yes stop_codon:yes gene_type:complete